MHSLKNQQRTGGRNQFAIFDKQGHKMYIHIMRAYRHMSDEPGRQDDGSGTEARPKRLVRSGGCEDVVRCRAFFATLRLSALGSHPGILTDSTAPVATGGLILPYSSDGTSLVSCLVVRHLTR